MAGNQSGLGMLGGISFQQGNCQNCGQPLYPGFNQMGHQCQPPDPRIMEKLQAIHRALDMLWTRAGEIQEQLKRG